MVIYIKHFIVQIKEIMENLPEHFSAFPISSVFFFGIVFIFILNVLKRIMIGLEKRQMSSYHKCPYLIIDEAQDCINSFYREKFKIGEIECADCPGKRRSITNINAENQIMAGKFRKRIVILLANFGRDLLPYLSFFYTLSVLILEESS